MLVVYGTLRQGKLIFPAAFESNGIYKNKFDMLISTKMGDGIKDYIMYIYSYNLETKKLSDIYQRTKDSLLFVLFQLGALVFPSGYWEQDSIPVFHIASRKNNL